MGKCGALPDGFRLEVIERNTIFLKQKTGEAEEGATEVPDCKDLPKRLQTKQLASSKGVVLFPSPRGVCDTECF